MSCPSSDLTQQKHLLSFKIIWQKLQEELRSQDFVTDSQTDRWTDEHTGKYNMSPDPII